MKAHLMYEEQDFILNRPMPWHEKYLTQDLELNTLFSSMAKKDEYLFKVAQQAILNSHFNDEATVKYRQEVLKDCIRNSEVVRELYQMTIKAIEREKENWFGIFVHQPTSILASSVSSLKLFVEILKGIREVSLNHRHLFESKGFKNLFEMLVRELDDAYLQTITDQLAQLEFSHGMLLSAKLGKFNEGADYVLRLPKIREKRGWLSRLLDKGPPEYTFKLHERDHIGATILSDIENRGVNQIANALAQSADHIDSFFKMLRLELTFYIGCLNLHETVVTKGMPICFPEVLPTDDPSFAFQEIYDLNLALTTTEKVVTNSIQALHMSLIVITGANRGGKSSFMRAVGVAQLMMQAGCFVAAKSFSGNLVFSVFTHYKREEDASMKSGKFDEELLRMSEIVDHVRPRSLVLLNESFASTNEREGSEIAREIVLPLIEKSVKVIFVTHMVDFADSVFKQNRKDILFLRAERTETGGRTYKLTESAPLDTSFADDLYRSIFLNRSSSENPSMSERGHDTSRSQKHL